MTTATTAENLDRDVVIARIKAALKRRSGKTWSVTGGRGTAWGWITINVPPARCKFDWEGIGPWQQANTTGYPSREERAELAQLLGLKSAHHQGIQIAASNEYRREYIQRAEGQPVTKIAEPYWD